VRCTDHAGHISGNIWGTVAAAECRAVVGGKPGAMQLDLQTLSVVTVFVTALLGALLVFAGLQNRHIRAPMWWGAAQSVIAAGLALQPTDGLTPDFVSVDLGNALVLLGYGLTWSGARVFDGRPSRLGPLLWVPVLWLAVTGLPLFGDLNLRVVVASALM